jgi:hypothetical protein
VRTIYRRTPKRCTALDMDGKRCREGKDVRPTQYHGEPEIYGSYTGTSMPSWVVTYLCKKHRND